MTMDSSIGSGLKVRQLNETLVTFFDVGKRRSGQPFDAEIFHGKRCHDRSIDDGPTNPALAVITRASQLPEKTAGEGISRSRWIEYFFQRIGRCGKHGGI